MVASNDVEIVHETCHATWLLRRCSASIPPPSDGGQSRDGCDRCCIARGGGCPWDWNGKLLPETETPSNADCAIGTETFRHGCLCCRCYTVSRVKSRPTTSRVDSRPERVA